MLKCVDKIVDLNVGQVNMYQCKMYSVQGQN